MVHVVSLIPVSFLLFISSLLRRWLSHERPKAGRGPSAGMIAGKMGPAQGLYGGAMIGRRLPNQPQITQAMTADGLHRPHTAVHRRRSEDPAASPEMWLTKRAPRRQKSTRYTRGCPRQSKLSPRAEATRHQL